ncbi:MAG: Ig-like domain-containing protein, partial [Candidatus Thiodiazotropha endolucinida]
MDLDEDGDLDVLSTSTFDNRVAWYENDGNENFTTHTVTTSATEARQVIAADVDGDGDLDLLSASRSSDKLAWYENDGFENFTLHTITAAAGPVSAVAAADIDGDGDLDVLATDDAADAVTWYENVMSVTTLDGAPTFVENGAAVVLDADVNVSDAELDALNSGQGDYNGASLTLVRNGAANSDDVFSFNDGNGITLSGSNLIKSSQIIASFDTTSTAGELVITFTNANGQTPTSADVDNILRQITYSNSNDAPPASVQIDWTFDDGNTGSQGSGGALQAVGSTTVTITAVNDDPTNAGSLPSDITVAENASSNVDLSAVDFSDVDAGAGTLTVTLTTSTGGNLSAAAGTGITIGGTSTARTLTGTLTDLNNYFNTASNITYLHGTPDTYGDDADTNNITINDNGNTGTGGGTNINLGTVNVDITPDNEVPTIANLGGDSLAYNEDDGAQVIDQGTASIVADVDSSDFDTGTLTVSFQAGSDNAEDVLAIRDQGAGPTNITVSGSAVSYGGTQIGTFTGGSGGTNLVITLDADADATAVTALVRNITYENTDTENPTTGARTVRFVLTDGDGGTSVDYDTTVTVSTVNDAPTLAATAANDTLTENTDTTSGAVFATVTIDPIEAGDDIASAQLTLGGGIENSDTLTINGTAISGLGSNSSGAISGGHSYSYTQATGVVTINFAASTNAAAAELVLESITYGIDPADQNPSTIARSITLNTVTDNGGGSDTSSNIGETATISVGAVNDNPTNAGSLPSDISVTEDVSSNVDLSAVDFSDVDAGAGTLTVTLTTSTGGDLSAAAGTGITIGGTSTARTLTGTLTDLNNYFDTASNITYLHGTANTSGNDADTIQVDVTDNGNTGTGGGGTINLGTVNVDITAVNDAPTLAATAANDTLTENTDTTSGAVFATVTIDPIEAGDDIASAQLTLGGGIENSDTLTINGTAISGLGSNSSGAISGGHSYSYTQATGVVTINFAASTNAAAAELVLESITYGIDPADQNPSTIARSITLNTVTDNGGGSDTSSNIGETATISVGAVNDNPTNAGSLPSDISVTEDVSSNVDLSAVDFSDVDAGAGTLTVTLTTSTGGDLSAAAGTGITTGGTSTARTLTGTLSDLNNYFNTASNITYLHGTANTNGNDADTINVTINDNGNTGSGGGTDINLGTVNVDITAVNDDPTNAGSLPSDVSVTEDVLSNVDLSAVDFADVDAASGTLTVTLTTSTGGDLSAAAGTGITIGGTSTALTLTGTLSDLNNYFNTASNITYLHGTANTAGDNADTIQVDITDNGNTGTGGGGTINLGTVNVDITAVNDAPVVVDLDGDIHNFTEGDGVVLIEQGGDAVVSDSDSSDYASGSLTVEVDSGLQPAEDRFSIFNQGTDTGEIGLSGGNVTYSGTLIGTVTGGTGIDPLTVTFNSNATSAAVTALVRNITYENSNLENPADGTRSVTIDITDGDGASSLTQNLTLNVSSVNDAPVVDLNGADGAGVDFAVTFTEDGGAVSVVDTDATISDVDNTTYQNLSINLSGFLDGVSEQITIAGYVFTYGTSDNQIRTVGSTDFEIDFDGTGFNVMLDGGGGMPEADLQSLLRGVTYENTSQDPTAGDRTINFFVQDSSLLNSPVATSTITVNPQNDAPTATDNANSVSENGFVSGNVITDDSGSGVDSDPEGDGLQVTQVEGGAYTPGLPVTLASGAQVTFQSNGSYTYNTNGQFDGLGAGSSVDDNFTYQIGDGNGGFDTATVTITINGSNNTPSITSADLTLDEGQTVTLGDANFAVTDADDTDFTYTVSGISGGYFQLSTNPGVSITSFTSANLTGGLVQFVDDGNEVAPAFSVTVNDGDIDSNTLAATINFTLVSDSTPIANNDSITVAEGGTVTTLDGGFSTVLNNDTGLVDAPVTVSLVTDVTNGSLTLNGDGTFSYTHDGSENFTDSFTYRVTDNDGETADATVTINVTPVSDATPVANADSITVAEGATATILVGGSSTVLNNDTGLGDTPVIVSLITDVTNGSLTLNGDGTFSYTHDGSENFTDSFTYRVTDNDGETADATVTINVTPVSDATPVANADSITVAEGATATTLVGGASTVLNNDTGLGDTPVTVSLVTDVTNGSLTLNGDGTFSYTHDGSENFTDSFTYRVTDNDGQTADATVTINVTPVANADSITVAEGGTVTTLVGGASTVLNNDTGLGDTPVTVSLVTDVTNGSLTLNGDGTFSYTHDGSENFTDSFTYRVTDNDGQTADATVTINITPVSDATPVANADSISVAEGGTITTLVGGASTVLNNDTGLGDTPVTVSLVTDVTNGSLTLNGDGTFSYTHDGSENFTDSFTYRVTDNDGETADATVTINVTPVSDETPVASADSITVAEGGTVTTLVGGASTVLNNDTGLGDTPVIVSLITDVANGSLTLNGDGTFSYTHDGSENFTDSFTYRVTDNDGETADATVTINVTPVSDATPVANADSITVAEGATATILVGGSSTVLNNDTGLGDTPVIVSLITDVTNGSLTLNGDGTFSYTHDGSENFTDSFTYRVTDNDGETADATVTINVTPVSDATPVANADSITVAEGATATTLVGGASSVLSNDTGLGDTPVTVSLVTDVTNGSLTLNGDGTFSYTHDGSENFTDSFTYRVTDNDGETADATVTINITPVSDQTPVANADSITVAEGATATTLVGGSSTVLNNDTGLGDTPVMVSLVTDVTNGSLTLNGDGTFSYTHDGSENFTDSFTYRVTDNDGETADATVTINITPVSDQTPVANADSITVAEGATATTLVGGASTVLNNDTSLGDTPVTVSLVTDVTNGSLTLNGDGTFSYTHDGSENFTDSFTYRVTDNDGQTADATVTINVTPVSDATPVANADSISVAEGGTITTLVGGASTVLNNDTGLGDTPVTVSLVTDVTNGSLTLNGDGTFSYTHDGSENFTDSFTYRVTDNDGQTADATVTINVTPVSDATPVANADSITVAEGATATTLVGGASTVLNNDTGLGDTPVTVSLVTDVTNGSLTLNGDGTFSYTHDGSENFTDSFTYRVTDNDGETADATVTINITPVSDATPVANADSISVAEGGTITTLVGGASTVLNNDTGLGDTPVTVSLVTDVTNGTLTLNGDGTFSYTHDGSENFTDSFTYRVTDNDGETADATVTINVTPVSDATPVANADSITVAEGATATTLVGGSSTVLNNDTGLGDTPVIVSLITNVTNGSLTLNGDGTFSYTHDGSENFTDSFTYRITDNDGETADATVTINVTPVSDTTPVANADSITVAEGATATTLVGGSSTVLNNDTGLGDTPVIVSLITNVTNGSLTLNGDGTFSYTHDGSENFTDSFTYRITD